MSKTREIELTVFFDASGKIKLEIPEEIDKRGKFAVMDYAYKKLRELNSVDTFECYYDTMDFDPDCLDYELEKCGYIE